MENLRENRGTFSVYLRFIEGYFEYFGDHRGTFSEHRKGLWIRFPGIFRKRLLWNIFRLALRLVRHVFWSGIEHVLVHFYSIDTVLGLGFLGCYWVIFRAYL